MCKDEAFYGVVGRAWVATLCYYDPTSSNPYLSSYGYNTGVNEKRQNVLATSEVIDNILLSVADKYSINKPIPDCGP